MEDFLQDLSVALDGLHGIDFKNLSISDIILMLILLGEVVTNLTPSEKDNSILNKIKLVIRAIPFLKDRRKNK